MNTCNHYGVLHLQTLQAQLFEDSWKQQQHKISSMIWTCHETSLRPKNSPTKNFHKLKWGTKQLKVCTVIPMNYKNLKSHILKHVGHNNWIIRETLPQKKHTYNNTNIFIKTIKTNNKFMKVIWTIHMHSSTVPTHNLL